MEIRPVIPTDAPEWLRLRSQLWDDPAHHHPGEIDAFFAQPQVDLETFV